MGIRVLGIAGSLRRDSYNRGLLNAARELAPAGVEIQVLDLHDVPLYDRDVEAAGDPASVTALKKAIRDAGALLLATPEYNGGPSAAIKNAVDWASRSPSGPRQSAIYGKPVAVIGGGGRGGAAGAQEHLRRVLARAGARVLNVAPVAVRGIWDRFDASGRLADDQTRRQLAVLLAEIAQQMAECQCPAA